MIRVLNEVMPGLAGLVAATRGKCVDEITIEDVVQVVEQVYGEFSAYLLDVIKRKLGSEDLPHEKSLLAISEALDPDNVQPLRLRGLLAPMCVRFYT